MMSEAARDAHEIMAASFIFDSFSGVIRINRPSAVVAKNRSSGLEVAIVNVKAINTPTNARD
jgi:hypothetical protein